MLKHYACQGGSEIGEPPVMRVWRGCAGDAAWSSREARPSSTHQFRAPTCACNWRTRSGTVHFVAKKRSVRLNACDHGSQRIAPGCGRASRWKTSALRKSRQGAVQWPPERYRMTEHRSPTSGLWVSADMFPHSVTGGFGSTSVLRFFREQSFDGLQSDVTPLTAMADDRPDMIRARRSVVWTKPKFECPCRR